MGRKGIFLINGHPFAGKHLLDVCSFVELLVQDSGITFHDSGMKDHIRP